MSAERSPVQWTVSPRPNNAGYWLVQGPARALLPPIAFVPQLEDARLFVEAHAMLDVLQRLARPPRGSGGLLSAHKARAYLAGIGDDARAILARIEGEPEPKESAGGDSAGTD